MVVVDRGMAFDDTLATIRERKLHYLVAARQSERDCWLDDFEADDLVEVLRPTSPNNPAQKKSKVWIARRETENELLVLCRSEGRIEKDRAIREKHEARLLGDLTKLAKRIEAGRLVKDQAIGEAIGRLRERYPRVARYWRIEYDHKAKRLLYAADEAKRSKAERLDGCYLLKTDRKDLSTEEAWKIYMTLTRAEDAFRDMKSPLAERPIFHHLEHRVETHIFLCLLAYHLLVAIETTLERQGMFTSWATVRDALRSHQIVTIVLPTTSGPVLRIRKGSTPEPHQRELYRLLGVPDEIIPPHKTWSRMSEPTA
jgi:transposase